MNNVYDHKESQFLKYFKTTWMSHSVFFQWNLSREEFWSDSETNNALESFHSLLSKAIPTRSKIERLARFLADYSRQKLLLIANHVVKDRDAVRRPCTDEILYHFRSVLRGYSLKTKG